MASAARSGLQAWLCRHVGRVTLAQPGLQWHRCFATTTAAEVAAADVAPESELHPQLQHLAEPDAAIGSIADTTVVRTREQAAAVMERLMALPASKFHAVDTECSHIDLKTQSPYGNGRVICLSVYSGPDIDFGNGPRLWVDNLDDAEVCCVVCGWGGSSLDAQAEDLCLSSLVPPQGTLEVFKPFLESPAHKKVERDTECSVCV